MDERGHLNTAARAALDLPSATRIDRIRSPRWIGYTRAKQLLDKLDDLLTHPKTHRMPNLLIVGDTNAGKTMLANRFVQLHPPDKTAGGEAVIVPVMAIQAPPGPDENRFYNAILEALCTPYNPRERVAQKQIQVLRVLKRIGLRMLIIDEIHNVLTGSVAKQRQFLNVLKYLGNDLQITLVGLGTKEALRALQADPQLANRFEPAALPPWQLNQDFQMLLASFEQVLPLRKRSRLADEPLARKLLVLSEGSLGELSVLLTSAAVYAVHSGTERIDERVLAAIDWIPPSERRRHTEHLL
ncbi:MAG: TniB family NTP-binding protein [Candidatus Competibacteraceae bacterium]|nr:TniB family NTP-binding protein [Candidatus Competibacteraceae bacterium]